MLNCVNCGIECLGRDGFCTTCSPTRDLDREILNDLFRLCDEMEDSAVINTDDKSKIQELANGSSMIWEHNLEVRRNNPVYLQRKILLKAFEKALTELEMCWARDNLSDKIAGWDILVAVRDDKGMEATIAPSCGLSSVELGKRLDDDR